MSTQVAEATKARAPEAKPKGGSSKRGKILIGIAIYVLIMILLVVIFGSDGKNDEFQPQEEFRTPTWLGLEFGPGDKGEKMFALNKATFYILLATALTTWTMIYIAKRMTQRPNRVQTAVEAAYTLMRDNITRGNMDDRMAAKWFPFIATLFLFIWFSNMIGYIPLPTNTAHKVDILGLDVPSLAIYAATANISVPLALTLIVWIAYHIEGVRAKGVVRYLKSWVPAGVTGPAAGPIFVIEVISHFVRLISLSVRLFANILAGHLLILFMGGGLVVLLGFAALGALTLPMAIVFFIFEVGLVASLQAFIFATLTSIYLGGAVAEHH